MSFKVPDGQRPNVVRWGQAKHQAHRAPREKRKRLERTHTRSSPIPMAHHEGVKQGRRGADVPGDQPRYYRVGPHSSDLSPATGVPIFRRPSWSSPLHRCSRLTLPRPLPSERIVQPVSASPVPLRGHKASAHDAGGYIRQCRRQPQTTSTDRPVSWPPLRFQQQQPRRLAPEQWKLPGHTGIWNACGSTWRHVDENRFIGQGVCYA